MLTHTRFATVESRDNHAKGWARALDNGNAMTSAANMAAAITRQIRSNLRADLRIGRSMVAFFSTGSDAGHRNITLRYGHRHLRSVPVMGLPRLTPDGVLVPPPPQQRDRPEYEHNDSNTRRKQANRPCGAA